MTFEEKLHSLAECGLKLKDQISVLNLIDSWGRNALDKPGYDLTLICLGMTQEEPPWEPHCDNLWHFDTECIEGDGSYIAIANRMAEMTQGSLPLTDIEDHVDIEKGEEWLRFKCHGNPVHIDCQVQDDWVDTGIFGRFVELLDKCDPSKLFIYYDLSGQDCIVGCVTREQFQMLKKVVSKVEPLL